MFQQMLLAASGGVKIDLFKPNFKGQTCIHFLSRNVKNDPEIHKVHAITHARLLIRTLIHTRIRTHIHIQGHTNSLELSLK